SLDGVRIYSLPITDHSPVTVLAKGDTVDVLGMRGGWIKVGFAGGVKGWMQGQVHQNRTRRPDSNRLTAHKKREPVGLNSPPRNKLKIVDARPLLNTNAQPVSEVHELYPFMGVYAPDRFQNSFAVGIRYEHHVDNRLSLGATLGFAKAGQEFVQQALGAAPEQGSSAVIFYSGRVTHIFPFGRIIPYVVAGLGVTRQHSESNLTLSLGFGAKFPIGERTYLRYEFNDHIFTSGENNTAWTNNNLEFSAGISFFLQ
ncbi:MAG: outer membrane beta-barrel protein, partial [bacterium]